MAENESRISRIGQNKRTHVTVHKFIPYKLSFAICSFMIHSIYERLFKLIQILRISNNYFEDIGYIQWPSSLYNHLYILVQI